MFIVADLVSLMRFVNFYGCLRKFDELKHSEKRENGVFRQIQIFMTSRVIKI